MMHGVAWLAARVIQEEGYRIPGTSQDEALKTRGSRWLGGTNAR
jgi:hypothetical protein